MMKRPKGARTIVVDGERWWWRCSRGGTITLWSPDGSQTHLRPLQVSGASEDEFERGQRKRHSGGTIAPADVAGAIRRLTKSKGSPRGGFAGPCGGPGAGPDPRLS